MSKRTRYTVNDIAKNTFYQLPKFLFDDEFDNLSSDAKLLYAILKDRHNMSMANGWINENNEVYFIYTREDMQDMLKKSYNTIKKALEQLKSHGLIEEERQGLNKPNILYLTSVDYESQNKKPETVENSGVSKNESPHDPHKKRTLKICESGGSKFESQEDQILKPNNNNNNNNNNNKSINQKQEKMKTKNRDDDDGWMDGLNSKIVELEGLGYENIESIKGALTSLWENGLPGHTLDTIRKNFEKITYEVIDTAWFRFQKEYSEKDIKHPIRYFASCIYNAISETNLHIYSQIV